MCEGDQYSALHMVSAQASLSCPQQGSSITQVTWRLLSRDRALRGRRPILWRLTGISVHSTFRNSPMRHGGPGLAGPCPTTWFCLCGPSLCLYIPWGASLERCLQVLWPSGWEGKCFLCTPEYPSMRGAIVCKLKNVGEGRWLADPRLLLHL